MLLDSNLGFYISCFKEEDAVKFCFDNIRIYYRDNPIYISSDGGSDFSDICDQNSFFVLEEDVLGYVNNPENKDPKKLIFCCREFLNRLKNAAEFCKTEYLIYYEPDILLRGKISINEGLKLNGSYANIIHKDVLSLISKYNSKNKNVRFGACGGSIMEVKSLLEIIQKTSDDLLQEIITTDKRVSNCDYLLTVLFSIFGFEYQENTDFIEAKRFPGWENTGHSLVHQYHQNYKHNYNGKYENFK